MTPVPLHITTRWLLGHANVSRHTSRIIANSDRRTDNPTNWELYDHLAQSARGWLGGGVPAPLEPRS